MMGDSHHPHMSMTDGRYNGKYVFINDKANSRVARIRCDIMKCDKMLTVPNVQAVHDLRVQKAPYTKYLVCNGEFEIPMNNDGKDGMRDVSTYRSLYNVIDAETMEMDMNLGEMIASERDHVVVFSLARCEAALKAGKFTTYNGNDVPVLDGLKAHN
jgi:nitrous-oxide reductase